MAPKSAKRSQHERKRRPNINPPASDQREYCAVGYASRSFLFIKFNKNNNITARGNTEDPNVIRDEVFFKLPLRPVNVHRSGERFPSSASLRPSAIRSPPPPDPLPLLTKKQSPYNVQRLESASRHPPAPLWSRLRQNLLSQPSLAQFSYKKRRTLRLTTN